MRSHLTLFLTLLILGAALLAACSPAEPVAPPENTDIPTQETAAPPAGSAEAYPAPGGETEVYIPITGSEENNAYPAPEAPIQNPDLGGNPYPGALPEDPFANLSPENIVKPEDLKPHAGDGKLTPGTVYIESVEAITDGTALSENVTLSHAPGILIAGFLPTPCHQLRVTVSEPDQAGNIQVMAYSLVDPNAMCIQVLEPFATFVPMENLPAGQYTVTVNDGEQTLELTIPEQ